jgi:hypothetical protein
MHYHLLRSFRPRNILYLFWLVDDIDVVGRETNTGFGRFSILVRDCSDFVVSNQLEEIFVIQLKFVVIQSGLISDLLGNKLSVMSSWNRFIYDFLLIFVGN